MSDSEAPKTPTPQEEEDPELEEIRNKYQALLKRRAQAIFVNAHLQNKAAEYYRRKKTAESQTNFKSKDNNADDNDAGEAVNENNQEQRYVKYIDKLKNIKIDLKTLNSDITKQYEETKNTKTSSQQVVFEAWNSLVELYRAIASQAISSRTGKGIPLTDIDFLIRNLEKKESEVSSQRLDHIKMTNKLKKKEMQLKQREELADGLHLIDFEQLKIENQTYNEKIEERNEELMKLHQKITNTVQVLTHYKEKLQFMESESLIQSNKLKVIETEVVQCRDSLTKHKQNRDKLRTEFHKLQQNAGLLGSIGAANNAGHKKSLVLLKDFEERQDETLKLEGDIEDFRKKHGELTLDIKVYEKKIEKVRQATNITAVGTSSGSSTAVGVTAMS